VGGLTLAPAVFNPKTGAFVIGAREFLIGINANLNTRDTKLAMEIATKIPRERVAAEGRRWQQSARARRTPSARQGASST